MATRRLYYEDPYLREFTARVTACAREEGGFAVVLERTAFYPEGGGQDADKGTLAGLPVLDVQERGGEVIHLLPAPLEPGTEAAGVLDWPHRFDLMQQHSGEHIVSGLIHQRFGCDNVGFHIGAETVTIDFNYPLTDEDMAEIQSAANRYIWENHPVEILWPTPAELETLEYRSKKALTGPVRITRFPGADCCACCGTHVLRSGEVGLVKLLSRHKFREGVRMEMVAGGRALARFDAVAAQNDAISALLSAKPLETAAAVRRLSDEAAALRYRLGGLEIQAFARAAETLRGAGDVLLLPEGLSAESVRRLAAAVLETCGGLCAVFSPGEAGCKYALGARDGDIRELVQSVNRQLRGRGGGKGAFAQGSVQAGREEIAAFFTAKGMKIPDRAL